MVTQRGIGYEKKPHLMEKEIIKYAKDFFAQNEKEYVYKNAIFICSF